MSRLEVAYTVTTATGRTAGTALVDSGADYTTLPFAEALELGLDLCTAKIGAVGTAGENQATGFFLRATVTVGRKSARIAVFAPVYIIAGKRRRRAKNTRRKIGHDFFQATKAQISYHQHPPRLSGVLWAEEIEWKAATPKREEVAALRKLCTRWRELKRF